MVYALRVDEARDQDRRMLAAWIARGADVSDMEEWLATDGAVASFERALELADLPALDAPDDDALEGTIISMQAWVNQVNAGMS